jgi:N-acetylmuramic acid 6-phosphate etherase
MVDMKLSNLKLVDRGAKMLVQNLSLPYDEARDLLLKHGSVRKAMEAFSLEHNLSTGL